VRSNEQIGNTSHRRLKEEMLSQDITGIMIESKLENIKVPSILDNKIIEEVGTPTGTGTVSRASRRSPSELILSKIQNAN